MKILLVADSCNPTFSSTPYFGYQIIRAIARQVDSVTLVTQVRNQDAVRAEEIGVEELAFLDSEYVARPLSKFSSWVRRDRNKALTLNVALGYPSNLAFEWEAWKLFRDRLRGGEFDVVHRVTPLSPTMPSLLARWSPVPFVIGPVNGGLAWPRAFASEMAREREWLALVKGLHKYMPFYRTTYRKAAAILAGFDHTRSMLPREVRDRIFDCPDVGFDEVPPAPDAMRDPSSPMVVLFVGRLVPYKCADVLVRAFARSPLLRRQRLVIIGDGMDRGLIESIIREEGLEDCVELTGWLPHDEVIRRMRAADIFAFPSIRELGAGVVIEAMGVGTACVVTDYGGPGAYASDGRGIAVPMGDKPSLINGFTRALERLASDPQERSRLGEAAQRYATALHTWDAKARKIAQVYEWILGRRQTRPDFFAIEETSSPDSVHASTVAADPIQVEPTLPKP